MLTGENSARISIRSFDTSVGDFGDVYDTSTNVTTVWATYNYKGGTQQFRDILITNEFDVEFIIRYRSDVTYNCKVIHDSQVFDIEYIEPMGRKAYLKLKCKRSENYGG